MSGKKELFNMLGREEKGGRKRAVRKRETEQGTGPQADTNTSCSRVALSSNGRPSLSVDPLFEIFSALDGMDLLKLLWRKNGVNGREQQPLTGQGLVPSHARLHSLT